VCLKKVNVGRGIVIVMAKSKDTDIIYKDFENQLNIEIDTATSKNQLDLAKILIQLSYVYEIINRCRTKNKITELVPYAEFDNNGGYESKPALICSLAIVQHYGLSSEWINSFYIAIFTHSLPVPAERGINIILPKGTNQGLTELANTLRRDNLTDSDSIIIEIPRKMSVESIRTYLSDNKPMLDRYLKSLTGAKYPRTEHRAMFIGQAVEFVLQDKPKATWPEILEELERIG